MDRAKPAAMEAKGLSFEIASSKLVDEVTLAVHAGEIVGVLGPNGAGKSTLLKLFSGELEPTAGSVLIDGKSFARTQPALLARRRAVVPQSSQLTFPFTALEVVMLGAAVPGFGTRPDVVAAGEHALAQVGLSELADRKYTDLSGGERQRVHVARALCQLASAKRRQGETPLLLVDEPTSSLDIGHQRIVLAGLRKVASTGAAVLAILHDINLAAGYCDRLVLMRGGATVAIGPPKDIVSSDLLSRTFGCQLDANVTPVDTPFVLPTAGTAETPSRRAP
jgi:iron complex transport system ATP-binding protein